MPFVSFLDNCQQRVETALDHWLPKDNILPTNLHKAMRYATLGGGKRVRPALVYATGEALGTPQEQLDGTACAVELIHAYSLIHDDLPAMDNDDLRRGKATCHKAFDEATAILAGDAMQALAFHILVHDRELTLDAGARLAMVDKLAHAAGSRGMAGGQAMDLANENREITITELEDMHIHKTGALIRASVQLGYLSSPALNGSDAANLDNYAKCVGLAFQIRDDILDVEGNTEILGKTAGADQKLNKSTYPSLLGMSRAKELAQELHTQAVKHIETFDNKADPLRWLADYIIMREN